MTVAATQREPVRGSHLDLFAVQRKLLARFEAVALR